ncbi:hypothetical protein OC25_18985 [Pedobacter kyungheensis]|uniref:YD repeat-containing protein n=1 Tax=Pedobacter kyungheensis TaxID=1069985 RepID=A0A0C1DD45_9SPHI|nr:hypothetical protein [Pedobacter kyungheensis]KIA91880.1 hypothetical protein OC25_18985 [Pedobacter kyungheensis]
MIKYNKHRLFLLLLVFFALQSKSQSINEETSCFYQSSKHNYTTKTETPGSDGSTEVSILIYPEDYAAGAAFTDAMVNKRLLKYPIEMVSMVVVNGQTYIKSGSITQYNSLTGFKEAEMALEISEPIPLASFKFSNSVTGQLPFTGSTTAFSPDSHYKTKVTYDLYSNFNKPLQISTASGISSCYLYDDNGTYVLAEISNAKLEDVAYTSFEPYTPGNRSWVYSDEAYSSGITGQGGYNLNTALNYTVSRSGLNTSKTYELTYWKRGENTVNIAGATVLSTEISRATNDDKEATDWMFVRHTFTNASSISISGSEIDIDELRLCPVEARMKTYTYKVMMTNWTEDMELTEAGDVSGRILRYEYDGLDRILNIKDTYYNTLETTQYNLRH